MTNTGCSAAPSLLTCVNIHPEACTGQFLWAPTDWWLSRQFYIYVERDSRYYYNAECIITAKWQSSLLPSLSQQFPSQVYRGRWQFRSPGSSCSSGSSGSWGINRNESTTRRNCPQFLTHFGCGNAHNARRLLVPSGHLFHSYDPLAEAIKATTTTNVLHSRRPLGTGFCCRCCSTWLRSGFGF